MAPGGVKDGGVSGGARKVTLRVAVCCDDVILGVVVRTTRLICALGESVSVLVVERGAVHRYHGNCE